MRAAIGLHGMLTKKYWLYIIGWETMFLYIVVQMPGAPMPLQLFLKCFNRNYLA